MRARRVLPAVIGLYPYQGLTVKVVGQVEQAETAIVGLLVMHEIHRLAVIDCF